MFSFQFLLIGFFHNVLYMYEINHIETIDPTEFMIMFAFKVGGINDHPKLAGISHLLEHLLFFGPNSKSINFDLNKFGIFNAETSLDSTCFYVKSHSIDAIQSIRLLFDVVKELTVNPKHFEIEKTVVIEEMKQTFSPIESRMNSLHINTPYGNNVIGTPRTIANITLANVMHHYNTYYNDAFVWFVSHPKNKQNFKQKIQTLMNKSRFAKEQSNKIQKEMQEYVHMKLPPKIRPSPPLFFVYKSKPIGAQAEIYIAIKTCPYQMQKWRVWFDIWALVTREKCFEVLREKYGYTYGVYARHDYYRDTGVLSVETKTFTGKKETLELVLQIMLDSVSQVEKKENIQKYLKYKELQDKDNFIVMRNAMWETMFSPKTNKGIDAVDYTRTSPKAVIISTEKVDIPKTKAKIHELVVRLNNLSATTLETFANFA